MTSVERLSRSQLGQLHEIGRGGQARVFRAPDLALDGEPRSLVFKQYKSKKISSNGLDRLIAMRLTLDDRERGLLDVLTNWPLRVVDEGQGRAAGVIIPLITDQFFQEIRSPTGNIKRVPRDGQTLTSARERLTALALPFAGLGDRYRFCRDLAFAVGFLHKRSVCVGDISFANAAFSFDLHPCVHLVDCDSFRFKGSAPVVPQLHTPDWIPPEGPKVQSERTDRYKLGLYFLRVLAPLPLAGQNRAPAWADRALDPRGRQMLRKALATDPAGRPTAREWYQHFEAALRTRPLATSPHRSRLPAPAVATAP